MKKAAGVIPARFLSTRFPGKPLALIRGKPMLQWVYEGASTSRLLERIIIATDDKRILDVARGIGAEAIMTSASHNSGTDRVEEAVRSVDAAIIINIQGDEPLIRGEMIDSLVTALQDENIPMASLMSRVKDPELAQESQTVKVVVDREGYALYFSRLPIPAGDADFFYRHIGLYGYQKEFLREFVRLGPSRLETCEKLEQLRALENGFRVKMLETSFPSLSVDTPQDIIRVEEFLEERER